MTSSRTSPKFDVSLSVFFPFHNEQDTIEELVTHATDLLPTLVQRWEVILVNDGSKDATGEIADRLSRCDSHVRVVHHEQNLGYGAALRSGFAAASMDYVFFTDGDGQFDLQEIPLLLGQIAGADIVCGIRRNRKDSWLRRLNATCWGYLVRVMLRFRCPDVDCAFKLFRRQVLVDMKLKSTGALISAEILSRATRKGCRIISLPVSHLPRRSGQATGAKGRVILNAFKELCTLRKDILR